MGKKTKYGKTDILVTNLDTKEKLIIGDLTTKIIRDEYLDETIILIKYLYNQGECNTLFKLGCHYSIKTRMEVFDMENKVACQPRIEETNDLILVRKYKSFRTEIDTDDIVVFATNGNNFERVNRLIEREEKEQLNNTIYKVKSPIIHMDKYESQQFLDEIFTRIKENKLHS